MLVKRGADGLLVESNSRRRWRSAATDPCRVSSGSTDGTRTSASATVVLNKLRQLQDLQAVIFLIRLRR
jgi:hypothetical protein